MTESYKRLRALKTYFEHVLRNIHDEGPRRHAPSILSTIEDTFENAIRDTEGVMSDIYRTAQQINLCDRIMREINVEQDKIDSFQYNELTHFTIFREYMTQLRYNTDMFHDLKMQLNMLKESERSERPDK